LVEDGEVDRTVAVEVLRLRPVRVPAGLQAKSGREAPPSFVPDDADISAAARTARGAQVGDLFMSLIQTARLSGENPFEYLTALQRNATAVRESFFFLCVSGAFA
jgi:hypothetical protein